MATIVIMNKFVSTRVYTFNDDGDEFNDRDDSDLMEYDEEYENPEEYWPEEEDNY